MTKFQAVRLWLWTLWQTVIAFFRGTSKDEPLATETAPGVDGEAKAESAFLSLVRSIGGRFKAASREIIQSLSSPYAASFVVSLLILGSIATWLLVSGRYEARHLAAQDEISILEDELLAQRVALERVVSERAALRTELAEVKLALDAAKSAPPAEAPPKVVYRKAAVGSQCKSNCLFGWSF